MIQRGHLCVSIGVGALLLGCASAPSAVPTPEAPPSKPSAPEVSPPAKDFRVLLAEWKGPHGGVPPFDAIDNSLFQPAFDEATKLLLTEVKRIGDSSEPPSFENTFAELERSGRALDRLATLFFTMVGNRNTPEIQALTREIRPMLSAVWDKIYFDEKLFARVSAVYEARKTSKLSAEQARLVEKTYDQFARRGARLDSATKARLGDINKELAKLFTDFGNRVQADEDTWVVLKKDDLAGLPASLVSTYEAAAKERKIDGFAVVNTRSAVQPFLTFSDNRPLREKVWRAFVQRGDNGNKNDTNALIPKIVALRAERAKLLGFKSHAHWRMSDTMAKEPERARELMMRVWTPALSKVKKEVRSMQALAKKLGARITIEPWDYRYYMEKVRKDRYDLDQSEFKNYFELENMIAASYFMAEKLYGYAFQEVTGTVPVFHADVRVFRVTKKADGAHVGFLYRDDFARQYKRSGAWQSTYRSQEKFDGQIDAIVSNNNNFIKGSPGKPVLISLDDARTLFHEFGHALHALTNDVTYPSLGRTPRDFVEFPSQVHENWVLTREVLDKFARHYKTGEPMPQKLLDRMEAAATFNQGFRTVEYLAAALLDMRMHTDPRGKIDPAAFEREALAAINMPKEIVLRHRLPQFMHLFTSDAYSAGYYSYLWSDVMASDAWAAFEQTGDPWHAPTAKKFKDIILATGDAMDRAEAYRQFRGRDPQVEALLKNRGLVGGN